VREITFPPLSLEIMHNVQKLYEMFHGETNELVHAPSVIYRTSSGYPLGGLDPV